MKLERPAGRSSAGRAFSILGVIRDFSQGFREIPSGEASSLACHPSHHHPDGYGPGPPIMMTALSLPRPLVLTEARHQLRPLLVFAPKADDPRLQSQCSLLQGASLAERNVVVVLLPRAGTSEPCVGFDPNVMTSMEAAEAEDARKRFHVPPDSFAVILIGKDGGEKLRSSDPIPAQKLLETIDAMPMRQQESRRYAEHRIR